MKTYIVGGYVRDFLLAQMEQKDFIPSDKDWVVVGSCPEEMLRLGFKSVGADFPVFLHPQTHEEYALARTERKTKPGYHGFEVDIKNVSLEEDLSRRDLTINSMALEGENVIDPFQGKKDLKNKILRHTSDAFTEDPVRILRVARFQAKFPSFTIHEDTLRLMTQMVEQGEADALTGERIYKEFSRAIMLPRGDLFIQTLFSCGFIDRIYPVFKQYFCSDILKTACENNLSLLCRAACCTLNFPSSQEVKAFFNSMKAPKDVSSFATIVQSSFPLIKLAKTPKDIFDIIKKIDALRQPDRFLEMLDLAQCLNYPEKSCLLLNKSFYALKNWSPKQFISTISDSRLIAEKIHEKQLEIVKGIYDELV